MGVGWQAKLKSGSKSKKVYADLNKNNILASDYANLSPADKKIYDAAWLKYLKAHLAELQAAYDKLDPLTKAVVSFGAFMNHVAADKGNTALLELGAASLGGLGMPEDPLPFFDLPPDQLPF